MQGVEISHQESPKRGEKRHQAKKEDPHDILGIKDKISKWFPDAKNDNQARAIAEDVFDPNSPHNDEDPLFRARVRTMFRATGREARLELLANANAAGADKLTVKALRNELKNIDLPLFNPGDQVTVEVQGERVLGVVTNTNLELGMVHVTLDGGETVSEREVDLATFNEPSSQSAAA